MLLMSTKKGRFNAISVRNIQLAISRSNLAAQASPVKAEHLYDKRIALVDKRL